MNITHESEPTGAAPVRKPTLGLALGGGSVFGYAHVGVLAALEEAGIRPDRLAGTSAGAIAASLYAFGVPISQIRERFATLTWGQITDVAPRRLGLFNNESLGALLEHLIGEARIEDALIPLTIMASDIETGERVALREGPVADAVRASACVPGLYAPVKIGSRQLVDGGILDNVPVSGLRMDCDVVVGVSLMADVPYSEVRTMTQVLINSASFALRESTRLDLADNADVVIRPDLSGRASWDADELPALYDAGRSSTIAAIPAIRAALQGAAYRWSAPAPAFTRRLARRLASEPLVAGVLPSRVSTVACESDSFCAFTLTSLVPASVVHLVSVWNRPSWLSVRVETADTSSRVRVPLRDGVLDEHHSNAAIKMIQAEIRDGLAERIHPAEAACVPQPALATPTM